MTATRYSDFAVFRRLLADLRPYWPNITGIFLLGLVSTPISLLQPVPLKIIVDNVIGNEPVPGFLDAIVPAAWTRSGGTLLIVAVALLIGVALTGQVRTLANALLRTHTAERIVLQFRARLFRHVQRLSLLYHDMRGTADSVYRIQYDTNAAQYIAIKGVIPFVTAIITLIAMLYVIVRLDAQLALVAMAISPVLFLIARAYRVNLRRQARNLKRIESAALSIVQETLGALRVVKAFGQEERERDRYVRRSHEGVRARVGLSVSEALLGTSLGLTTAIGTAVVLLIGVRHVQSGTLTLGALLLIMAYLTQLYGPLQTISRKIASIQNHLASLERAYALLDEAPDVIERPDARPVLGARGAVTFRDVAFSYDGGDPVLADIDLEVPAGTRLGIAGKTGAGKTTLMSLLMRFHDPTGGEIRLDGIDLRDYRLASLRDQFAIVLQEPLLFSTTIAENIGYGRPGAGAEEIARAARAANVHDFIAGLPEGYQTEVGERGMRLSGGERQRIALARAFVKDAPILILDEPTSSVDMRTETGIMEAMERLMQDRTTFLIAHRLTTLESCDIMAILDGGRLVEVTSDASEAVRRGMAGGGF